MGVAFTGRIIAPRIEPGTPLPYVYTTGESISAKDIVCKGENDGKIYKSQADTWDRMPAFGVAIQTKGADASIQVVQFGTVSSISRTEDFSWDDKIYVSTTLGKATRTPPGSVGNIVQSIGRAVNASDIILEVDPTVVEIVEI